MITKQTDEHVPSEADEINQRKMRGVPVKQYSLLAHITEGKRFHR